MDKGLRNATLKELEKWPGVTMTEEDGGKHAKAILHYQDQSRMVVVAKTPSDVRAVPNHLAVVRREIRAMGAEPMHVAVGLKKDISPTTPKKEVVMTKEPKEEAIFKMIGDLRYSEMLSLAEFLRDVATEMNMQRGIKDSWAKMLQLAVDTAADRG